MGPAFAGRVFADGHRSVAEGGYIERGFYVQVRYPHADRWETVAVSAARGLAASMAGDMYRDLRNGAGQAPSQVRIASDELLRREGGDASVRRAAADLWQRAQAASRDEPPSVNPA